MKPNIWKPILVHHYVQEVMRSNALQVLSKLLAMTVGHNKDSCHLVKIMLVAWCWRELLLFLLVLNFLQLIHIICHLQGDLSWRRPCFHLYQNCSLTLSMLINCFLFFSDKNWLFRQSSIISGFRKSHLSKLQVLPLTHQYFNLWEVLDCKVTRLFGMYFGDAIKLCNILQSEIYIFPGGKCWVWCLANRFVLHWLHC